MRSLSLCTLVWPRVGRSGNRVSGDEPTGRRRSPSPTGETERGEVVSPSRDGGSNATVLTSDGGDDKTESVHEWVSV